MKLIFVSIITLALLATACGSSNSNDTSSKREVTNETAFDKTDKSECQLATSPDATVYGSWRSQMGTNDGLDMFLVMTVSNTTLKMTNTCDVHGQTATVSIEVPVEVTATTITVLSPKSDSVQVGGVTCSASQTRGSINYKLSGNCLNMTAGNQNITMVRSY